MLVGGPLAYSDLVVCLVVKARFLPFLVAANIELSWLYWRVDGIIFEIWVDVFPDFVAFCLIL